MDYKYLKESEKKTAEIYKQYNKGLIGDFERYLKIIDVWTKAKADIEATRPTARNLFTATDRVYKAALKSKMDQCPLFFSDIPPVSLPPL